MTPQQLEFEVLVHRYCYYVLCDPILPDCEYDKIEREARSVLPDDSPVQRVGSDRESSYAPHIRSEARRRKGMKA